MQFVTHGLSISDVLSQLADMVRHSMVTELQAIQHSLLVRYELLILVISKHLTS